MYQTTQFICMILGIELTYIDTKLIHHNLGLDVSVSRRSGDPLMPRSRLGRIGKHFGLDLGIKGLGLGIDLRQLGLLLHIHGKKHYKLGELLNA